MKPAVFDYHDPRHIDEALELLGTLGDAAKALAGGQSLVPLMNFRLARPAHLVDLNRVAGLADLRTEDGWLVIGAMARQHTVERSPLLRQWPLIGEALGQVGHLAIRCRGTIGGSLAHGDPAAELPAVMAALDARFEVRSRTRRRASGPGEFFVSQLTTSLQPDELLVEVRVPPLPPRTGWSFREISRRHGDFALVGVAALLTLDPAGAVERARLVFTGVGPVPTRAAAAEAALVGQPPGALVLREAAELAARDLDPPSDLHASAEYRREVAQVLAREALVESASRAVRAA